MAALDQYIQLYNAHRDTIDNNSAPALNRLRPIAAQALAGAKLPVKGDEDYEATDLEALFADDYGININRINLGANPADAFRCEVPNMSTCLFFLANDVFFASDKAYQSIPEGVVISSLKQAATTHREIVEARYGSIADINDPATALNTLLTQDGLFVYVPENVRLNKPIQLVNILNSASPLMAVRRMLIVLERGAQAQLLVCDHTQNKDVDYLASQVVEIFADNGATFDYYDIEDSSTTTRRVSTVYVNQDDNSNVMLDGITLRNGLTRNNYKVDLNGNDAELHLLGMAIADNNRHIDNHTVVNHIGKRSKTDELFKYVLDDNAIGAFSGLIRVAPGAEKTVAYQSNKNICASPSAKMHSKPQLIIDCDDVKCSHGSTIGQIDKNALFYMRSRGVPEHEARIMLMQAFMNDVIAGVRMESLKDRLRHLVESRFGCNQASSCASCRQNQ